MRDEIERGGGGSGGNHTQLNIWPHQTYANAEGRDRLTHSTVVRKMDVVCDVFEDYFGDFTSFSSISAENYVDEYIQDPVIGFRDIESPDGSDLVSVLKLLEPEADESGTYNLLVVADADGKLGVNRGGKFNETKSDVKGGIGYVNMALPYRFDQLPLKPTFRIPADYMDSMALHEVLHAYSDQPGCPDDHENGVPNVQRFTRMAKPSIMASGYTFMFADNEERCEPDVQCNGDNWKTTFRRPRPQLVISECTHQQIEEYIGFSTRSGAQDFNSYR